MNISSHSSASGPVFMEIFKAAFTWPYIGTQALAGIIAIIVWRKYFYTISDVPGPFFASFTRLWHLVQVHEGDQNLQMIELHDKHGHFVRISYDEKLIVIKGYWYKGTTIPDYRYIAPMSVCDPKAKIALSKALSPGYSQSNVLQYEPYITRTIAHFLDWMDKYAQNRAPMNLNDFFAYATFDVIGEVVFARPFGFLDIGADIGNSIANSEVLSYFAAVASFYPNLRNVLLSNPFMTWLGILPMGHVFNTTMTAVKEREKNADSETQFVIVDHWLRALRQQPERLRPRNVYAQATNNVGAGADTVNCGLQSFFYHLLRNPETLAKAKKEVDDAVKDGRCTSKVVSFSDAQQLHYVQACIKEALRFFTPVSMGLPRRVPVGGMSIGDRTFSAGTILSVNPWVIHRSTELWGSDARRFNPERWFRDDAAELEKKYFIPKHGGKVPKTVPQDASLIVPCDDM
ncbi:cytochrome P450 [Diaporthe amygdali]|uniref:cytochrome P450 n=1 Tax=Phomopsis amygdali TaxID=1214568 RepID=UPI0022FE6E5B|nr:cytochrome P450 [Diaporthe amygdali]KAJ0109101.1 cytochrome P450 [Diaporthe amygdali]